MIKAPRTWILVANSSRARIYENHGVGRGIEPVKGADFANEVRHDRDTYSDRPGRVQDSAGPGRHAMERPTGAKQQNVVSFARSLTTYLQEQRHKGAFDRLVLIAEPTFLGHLRSGLAKPVSAALHAEIAKDLTRETDSGLAAHLQSVLAV